VPKETILIVAHPTRIIGGPLCDQDQACGAVYYCADEIIRVIEISHRTAIAPEKVRPNRIAFYPLNVD
jgi:hypothetical protein